MTSLPAIDAPELPGSAPDAPSKPMGHRDTQTAPSLWTFRGTLLLVFLAFALVHCLAFRSVLSNLPDLLAGRSVINTSELVPFFAPDAQLLEQASGAFSELTHSFEFRIRYSMLTTWMRYYLILPFAIVLAPLLGSFAVFLVLSAFLVHFLPTIHPRRIMADAALATLFIHLILLPAKITHFYTLILGFDLYTISFILLLRGLFTERVHPTRYIVASSLIALVNPGVHFLVLYPITVFCLCALTLLLHFVTRKDNGPATQGHPESPIRPRSRQIWKRTMTAMLCTVFLTLLPYGLFIKYYVLRDIVNLTDIVPDSLRAIQTNSLPFLHQLTFDLGSVTNNYLSGGYLNATPRYGKLFYFLLVLIPFLVPVSGHPRTQKRIRSLLLLLLGLLLFSMWCSLGYVESSYIPTFHTVSAAIFNRLSLSHSRWAEPGMQLLTKVIQVLRYPDRFQFISYAIALIPMTLGILYVQRACAWFVISRRASVLTAQVFLSILLFFVPLLSYEEYRATVFSGDFGGFVRPYSLQRLREIKDTLATLPQGRTVVLPPSETNWVLQDAEGASYKFIDKFYIYFFNQPSYYYGLTGDIRNKYNFFLLLQSLQQNEQGWVNLARNLGIRYLIVNRELQSRASRIPWYLRDIAQSLEHQTQHLPQYFRILKENESFALYEFIDPQSLTASETLLDLDWSSFRCLLQRDQELTQTRHTTALVEADATVPAPGKTTDTLAERTEKVLLDLFAMSHPTLFVRPDSRSFAFNPDHIASSEYFGTVFPMFNLITGNAYNPMNMVLPGPFDTLTSTFVGLPRPTAIRFPLAVEENGTYEILLRAAPTMHQFSAQVDEGEVLSTTVNADPALTTYVASESVPFGQKKSADVSHETSETLAASIPKKIFPVSRGFGYIRLGTMALLRGQHWLILTKSDSNPLVLEGILLFPVGKSSELKFTPTQNRFISPSSLIPSS